MPPAEHQSQRISTAELSRSSKSGNFVYCISCYRCPVLYIGETERNLRSRFGERLQNIRMRNNTPELPVAQHFNSTGHCISDVQVRGVGMALRSGTDIQPKQREMRVFLQFSCRILTYIWCSLQVHGPFLAPGCSNTFLTVYQQIICLPFPVNTRVTVMTIGSLSKDVFERRTSTGSETFSLFICLDTNKFVLQNFFSLIKTIYPRVSTKPFRSDAKSPLPVDVRRSKTLLLKLPNIFFRQCLVCMWSKALCTGRPNIAIYMFWI